MINEQPHVFRKLAPALQLSGKSVDGHVGYGEQPVKHDSKAAAEFLSILRLKLFLRWRQKRPHRVVNKVQLKLAPVAELIKALQSLDAFGKDAHPTLLLDVSAAVAR